MDYTNYNFSSSKATASRYDEGLRAYMLQVYNYMALALLLTGVTAMFAGSSEQMLSLIYNIQGNRVTGLAPLGWLVTFAPLGIVLAFSFGLNKLSTQTVQLLFWLYSFLLGLSLSSIFLMYTGESIARIFFITASIFGGMSLYGYTTKKDLTNFGSFLIMGLIGIIIASLVNVFLKSSGLNFILSIVIVLVFTGLTAYDTQKIKNVYFQSSGIDSAMATKISVMGALTLYMDFINIFIHLIQLFGNRRSD